MDILETEISGSQPENAEITREIERFGFSAEYGDNEQICSISQQVNEMANDGLTHFMAHGLEYPEAIEAQIIVCRILLLKMNHLQEMFEASRH